MIIIILICKLRMLIDMSKARWLIIQRAVYINEFSPNLWCSIMFAKPLLYGFGLFLAKVFFRRYSNIYTVFVYVILLKINWLGFEPVLTNLTLFLFPYFRCFRIAIVKMYKKCIWQTLIMFHSSEKQECFF
jgi:hypothetical protein